jgi:DNA-binding NtrC family response regulator
MCRRRALESNGGRRAATARKLGVTREGLYN